MFEGFPAIRGALGGVGLRCGEGFEGEASRLQQLCNALYATIRHRPSADIMSNYLVDVIQLLNALCLRERLEFRRLFLVIGW